MHHKSKKPLCFIIMPFTSVTKSVNKKYSPLNKDCLDTIYDELSKCFTKFGYAVRRASSAGNILADIVYSLDSAELVCADLTGLNPNVMYELGIRHAFTKKTILLSQDVSELPFDLKNYHCIEYKWVTTSDKKNLFKAIQDTLKLINTNPDTTFGPVHSHLGTKRLGIYDEEIRITKDKLYSLYADLSMIQNDITMIFSEALKNIPEALVTDGIKYTINSDKIPEDMWRSEISIGPRERAILTGRFPSIDLLMSTRYIPKRFDQFKDITHFYSILGTFHYELIRFVIPRRLIDIERVRQQLFVLLHDLELIQVAVATDNYGNPLNTISKKWMDQMVGQMKEDFENMYKERKQHVDQSPESIKEMEELTKKMKPIFEER